MSDMDEFLQRNECWQKERRLLPWPEKLRMAATVRESLLRFRQTKPTQEAAKSQSVPRMKDTPGIEGLG